MNIPWNYQISFCLSISPAIRSTIFEPNHHSFINLPLCFTDFPSLISSTVHFLSWMMGRWETLLLFSIHQQILGCAISPTKFKISLSTSHHCLRSSIWFLDSQSKGIRQMKKASFQRVSYSNPPIIWLLCILCDYKFKITIATKLNQSNRFLIIM